MFLPAAKGSARTPSDQNAIYSGNLRLCQQPRAAQALRLDQNAIYSGHLRLCQHPRAAHALCSDQFKEAFGNNDGNDDIVLSSTETMERIDKIMNKVKYSAFGKVIRKNEDNDVMKNKPEEVNLKLLEYKEKR